jgi:hypothetical protein
MPGGGQAGRDLAADAHSGRRAVPGFVQVVEFVSRCDQQSSDNAKIAGAKVG